PGAPLSSAPASTSATRTITGSISPRPSGASWCTAPATSMVEAPPRDEHALVVVKPGPRAAEVSGEVAVRAAALGLETVARRRRRLDAAAARAAFKYGGPPFVAMWCGGESEAWLLRGPDAPERTLALKQELRADLGADGR